VKILVDADSCPKMARELTQRRAVKLGLRVLFVANRPIPRCSGVEMIICPNGENSADDRIAELAESGDLVITRDVPFAKRLVEKSVFVINDRGRAFTKDNINELLSIRNFMTGLADNGLETERTANYGKKELKMFADALDRVLYRHLGLGHPPCLYRKTLKT
jgi:uncharacterized protein YaiI (UPF0178 family)